MAVAVLVGVALWIALGGAPHEAPVQVETPAPRTPPRQLTPDEFLGLGVDGVRLHDPLSLAAKLRPDLDWSERPPPLTPGRLPPYWMVSGADGGDGLHPPVGLVAYSDAEWVVYHSTGTELTLDGEVIAHSGDTEDYVQQLLGSPAEVVGIGWRRILAYDLPAQPLRGIEDPNRGGPRLTLTFMPGAPEVWTLRTVEVSEFPDGIFIDQAVEADRQGSK